MAEYWTVLLNRVSKAFLSYISPSLSFIASSSIATAAPAAIFFFGYTFVLYLFFARLLSFYVSFRFDLRF